MHNHTHPCECKHVDVKFCNHCKTVYCLSCNQEWNAKHVYWNQWYPYSTLPAITYNYSATSGVNHTVASGQVIQNSAKTAQATCNHQD